MVSKTATQIGLPWHVVEEAINRESEWLQKVIVQGVAEKVPGCDECQHTFRKIALLIVTGKVGAKEFITRNGYDLWDGLTQKRGITKSAWHGGEWHREMMDAVSEYFKCKEFEVVVEPFLGKGRADLGVYRNGYSDLFIEIGTTSVYKLWWNLNMFTGCKILLVTDKHHAIEFTCHDKQDDKLRNT